MKWRVSVYGYDDEDFEAETRAKAMYAAYRAFCESRSSRSGWDFHKFLINTQIWKLHP